MNENYINKLNDSIAKENREQRNALKHQFESKFNNHHNKYNLSKASMHMNTRSVDPNRSPTFGNEEPDENALVDSNAISSLCGLPKVFHNKIGLAKPKTNLNENELYFK